MSRADRVAKQRRASANRRARASLERRTQRAAAGRRAGDEAAPAPSRRGAAGDRGRSADELGGAGVRAATISLLLAAVSSAMLLALPIVRLEGGGAVRLVEEYGWRAATLLVVPVTLAAVPLLSRRSSRSVMLWTVAAAAFVVWLVVSGPALAALYLAPAVGLVIAAVQRRRAARRVVSRSGRP